VHFVITLLAVYELGLSSRSTVLLNGGIADALSNPEMLRDAQLLDVWMNTTNDGLELEEEELDLVNAAGMYRATLASGNKTVFGGR
jgi:hypothetical protein